MINPYFWISDDLIESATRKLHLFTKKTLSARWQLVRRRDIHYSRAQPMPHNGAVQVYRGRTVEVSTCTKYFLFGFNTLFWVITHFPLLSFINFWLVGLALLVIGFWAWTEKGFFDNISEVSDIPFDPVILIISIGIIMFTLSFTGCLGSLRENICLLKFVRFKQLF